MPSKRGRVPHLAIFTAFSQQHTSRTCTNRDAQAQPCCSCHEHLLITGPACPRTLYCCTTRISVSLTHYTFFKKGGTGASTFISGQRAAPC